MEQGQASSSTRAHRRCLRWMLEEWQPKVPLPMLLAILVGISAGCAGLAAVLLLESARVRTVEMVRRYDDLCGSDTTCTVPFPIQHDMEAPINVYYGLTSFNQNTRLYTGTFGLCTNQLQAASSCSDAFHGNGTGGAIAFPEGLQPFSLMNDVFTISVTNVGGQTSPANTASDSITWANEADKFGTRGPAQGETLTIVRRNQAGAFVNVTMPNVNKDQAFQNWLKPAALPRFRKLFARVMESVVSGSTITITIGNHYEHPRPDGHKFLVLSTKSWMGTQNDGLGIAFAVLAGIYLLAGLTLGTLYLIGKHRSIQPVG